MQCDTKKYPLVIYRTPGFRLTCPHDPTLPKLISNTFAMAIALVMFEPVEEQSEMAKVFSNFMERLKVDDTIKDHKTWHEALANRGYYKSEEEVHQEVDLELYLHVDMDLRNLGEPIVTCAKTRELFDKCREYMAPLIPSKDKTIS